MRTYLPYSVTLLFLLIVQAGYAQSEMDLLEQVQNRITITHNNGEKEVFMVTPKKIQTHANHLYHWYRSQRVQQTQGGYAGKLLDGAYSRYDANKQLMRQGTYKKGLPHGDWKEWRTNHRLAKEERWKKGKLEGEARHYNEHGQLLLQGKKKDGEWDGKVWSFDTADSSYRWDYYAQGAQISRNEYIDANMFRRTGRFFGNLWNGVFRRAPQEITVID